MLTIRRAGPAGIAIGDGGQALGIARQVREAPRPHPGRPPAHPGAIAFAKALARMLEADEASAPRPPAKA